MEMVNGLADADVRMTLLAVVHVTLGTMRAIEGLDALGLSLFSRVPPIHARYAKAVAKLLCGLLYVATALMLRGER